MKVLTFLVLGALCVPACADALDAPLRIRNTGPVAGLYGLPRALGGAVLGEGREWVLGLDYGNSYTAALAAGERIYLDGETGVASLAFRAALADRWEWGMELPWIGHKDGALDGFIDGWHDLFGLPEGGRDQAPRGRLNYFVQVDGRTDVEFLRDRSGSGDPRAWVGRSLYEAPERSGALRLQVKVPLGSVDELTGSQAMDAALWWEHDERNLFGLSRLAMSSMLGGAYLGGGELVRKRQKHLVGVGSFGLRLRVAPRVQLNFQADGHGALFDAKVGELGDAGLQGTIGGRVRLARQLWLDLGVVENLISDSAPDVVFLLHLSGRW